MTLRMILFFALLLEHAAGGQILISGTGGPVRLSPSDTAILDGHEIRRDFNCLVKPIRPELGFDFSLHSGYTVTVSLKDLAGPGDELTALFRVIPDDSPDRSAYFDQKWRVPPIARNAKGTADLRGGFLLGEGKFRVDWLMRDGNGRYCSTSWSISADARGRNKEAWVRLARGEINPQSTDLFSAEAPVPRDVSRGSNVLVMVNIAAQRPEAGEIQAREKAALASILRTIAREPRIRSYSVAAFNLEREKVLFRSRGAPEVDFPALGMALRTFELHTIDVHELGQKDAGAGFLTELLAAEVNESQLDALIFVGPKTASVSWAHAALGASRGLSDLRGHVFYLSYLSDETGPPGPDPIGSLVRFWKGLEYTIARPRDLLAAWNEVMSRISTDGAVSDDTGPTAAFTGLAPKK